MNLSQLLDDHPLPAMGDGGKDDKANVVIVGGPADCPGAVVLAATAALRTGAGRVRVATHPDVAAAVGVAVPEIAVYPWAQDGPPPEDVAHCLGDAEVVLVGCGHQHLDDAVVRAVAELATDAALILDAGALPAAAGIARTRPVVLAPNPTEAHALLSLEADAEDGDETTLACRLTARFGHPVAVRGESTVIAEGERWWVFDDAPSGLGTPGSGDVFAGVLAALVASLRDPTAALGWAVHLHAAAAARLAAATPVGYRASDVVDELPYALADACAGRTSVSPGR